MDFAKKSRPFEPDAGLKHRELFVNTTIYYQRNEELKKKIFKIITKKSTH